MVYRLYSRLWVCRFSLAATASSDKPEFFAAMVISSLS